MKNITTYLLGILLCGMLAFQPLYSMANVGFQVAEKPEELTTEKIRIFPNPTEGRFSIQMDYKGNDRIVAKVYDITGKVIKDISSDLITTKSSVTADVNLDHPSSGIYFLRVEIGNKIATKKIIIK